MARQKTVLVTGCSAGGVGDALAQEYHRQGLRVIATARNLDKIQHLKGMGLEIIRLDVEDAASIRDAVFEVQKLIGSTLDMLVNNAGIGYYVPLVDADIEYGKKLFNVNVLAVLAVTQAFTKQVVAAKGTIVNVGSVGSLVPVPFQGLYVASKAALFHLTACLRIELAPFGVKVVHIQAGGLKTDWAAHSRWELPDTSIYAPFHKEIESALHGPLTTFDKTYPVHDFAARVVKDSLGSRPPAQVWVGTGVWGCWIASFFWHTFQVSPCLTENEF
ncbi:NAD(P)-binding protein [Coniochaeta sp. PMI_546]|nr:NAD(P)-binding protein [Coniochaeta sp. PMI_546]